MGDLIREYWPFVMVAFVGWCFFSQIKGSGGGKSGGGRSSGGGGSAE